MLQVNQLQKRFTLHNQGGVSFSVLDKTTFSLETGECLALVGDSGAGKSTLLRTLYANYLPHSGSVKVQHQGIDTEMVDAEPRVILAIRRQTMGYIAQFLRVIPRVSTLDIVSQPLLDVGASEQQAQDKAKELLSRLNLPERLWKLAPATFSGGEQQRVNIATGMIAEHPILLLDEPTASLDATNKQVVVDLINESKARGTSMIGIFHDVDVREAVCDRHFYL